MNSIRALTTLTTSRARLVAIALLLAAACGGPNKDADKSSGEGERRSLAGGKWITDLVLIDSAQSEAGWDPMADTTTIFRYVIITTAGTDTLDMVVPPDPFVIGDTAVMGLILVGERELHRELFTFVKGRPLKLQPLPDDVWYYFNDVVPSPDGRFLAYVADDTMRGTFAAVRDLRTGRLVARGRVGGGCECDVDQNHARWISADSFEIAVSFARATGNWEIVSGRASKGRIHSQTVALEPEWH